MHKYLLTFLLSIGSLAAVAQRPFFPPFPTRARMDSMRRLRESLRDTTPPPKDAMLSIGFEPFFTFNNCFKFDIAWKPANHKYAIELTPEVYSGQHVLDHYLDNISGFGIGLYYQAYIYQKKHHPIILSYGATYRNIDVAYADEGFIPFEQNSLQYYRYKNFDDVLKINSLLVNVNFTARVTNNTSAFFVDFYTGVGYKFSSGKSTYPGYRTYTSNLYNYAYNGPLFLLGFKLGPSIFFGKVEGL